MFAAPVIDRARVCRQCGATSALIATLLAGSGCAVTVRPPADVQEPTVVYLVDYGRHSGLILPRDDGALVEYAYGEWQWYALGRQQPLDVLRALLVPTRGALGRRAHQPDADGDWLDELTFETSHVFVVERAEAVALRDELDAQWERRAETVVENPQSNLALVQSDESYWLCNNCNPVMARWLRALGCEVAGFALWSQWRFQTAAPLPAPGDDRPLAAGALAFYLLPG